MGVGGGSGGGGFKLEKTWRSTGVGTQTFNSPGNFTFPYGKYVVEVAGQAAPGSPVTPGNIASYNPQIPGNIASYNPQTPSNISSYNPVVPGNATGSYNPPSGGNLAGYVTVGGNLAGYNAGNSPVTSYTVYATEYVSGVGLPAQSSNATGSYNPPSGGNLAGYNPPSGGNAITNSTYSRYAYVENYVQYNGPYIAGSTPPSGSSTYRTWTTYLVDVTPIPCPIGQSGYNTYYMEYYSNVISCSPLETTPGNVTGYNTLTPGNALYNPYTPGTAAYNATLPAGESFSFTTGPNYVGVYSSIPSPFTYSGYQYLDLIYAGSISGYRSEITSSVTFSGTASTTPGNPGNAIYNSSYNEAVFNPTVPGNQNYNSATGGTPNYNAVINSTANYNAPTGQTANYNSPVPGSSGSPMTVLGVYFPGGLSGAPATYVTATINTYDFPDDSTQLIDVVSGGYVNITLK